MRKTIRWVALGAFLSAGPALAADPFELDLTVTGAQAQNRMYGFASVEDAFDQLQFDELASDFGYQGFERVEANLNFRGLPAELEFPVQSGELRFFVEGVDLDENSANDHVFFRGQGQTLEEQRDDAIEQLKDYLKENKFALKALLTRLAQTSPIDPLAGNPLSLMTQRARGDYERGFTHRVSQIWGCNCSAFELNRDEPFMVAAADDLSGLFLEARDRAMALRAENEIGVGLIGQTMRGTAANGTDYRSWQIQLPFSYTVKFDADPRKKLYFELPLSYTDSEGAASYTAGFGIAYSHPLTDSWSLTPAVGVGATGSEDLGAAGGVASYSIASSYSHRLGDWSLSLGNLIGRYESIGLKIGDVEAEADVSNTVFTNGLMLSGPGSLIAKGMVMEYSFADTRLRGTEVFSNRYDEVGVALGFISTRYGVITRYFKTGLSYLWGENDIDGLRLNLSLRF
jgi:hypothetical protein